MRPWSVALRTVGLMVLTLAATGCGGTPKQAELRIKILNASTQAPLDGALISIEKGGIYVNNPDPSLGSPAYVYGATAGNDGTVRMMLPTAKLGVHTFYAGHYYGSRLVQFDQDLGITVNMEAFQNDETPPALDNAALDPSVVAAGEEFTVSADVTRGDPDDPLSDEVVVVFADEHFSRALDPPSAGVQGVGFPDGTWQTTLTAPDNPGSYDYHLAATSEHCVTSDPITLTLEVE